MHGTFVTAINCMDGRTQEPVISWMKIFCGAHYVNTITEPGPDGILAHGPAELIQSIRRRVEISVNAHGSKVVAVVAHGDCAGNPVSREEHLTHLAAALERVAGWGLPVRWIGLYVNERWLVEVISNSVS